MEALPHWLAKIFQRRRIDPNKTIAENLATRTAKEVRAIYEATAEDTPATKQACEKYLAQTQEKP